MSRVSARVELPTARIPQVEELWYDRERWPAFIEGLRSVVVREGPYPEPGARTVWESVSTGRGRVEEEVVAYAPGASQELAVSDPQLTGRQCVRFEARPGGGPGVRVTLELDYRLRKRGPVAAVVDLVFVRRAQAAALERTLLRLRAALKDGEW
ncbi:unannotated protein [freshwater metagenome]|uniref:Unannotated protein n=1 Tax=freshwater metagenome TaxID=449393 RepID=A0A6J7J055_9ZZZZ|nr:hypothetical protein [Actinomycetota bacterium]